MKISTILASIFFTLLLTINIFASKSTKCDLAKMNYMKALESGYQSMIESAVINIMKLKMATPSEDFSELAEKLDQISKENSSKFICYEAYIVSNYLKFPERFNWIKAENSIQKEEFFNQFSKKLKRQLQNINRVYVSSGEN